MARNFKKGDVVRVTRREFNRDGAPRAQNYGPKVGEEGTVTTGSGERHGGNIGVNSWLYAADAVELVALAERPDLRVGDEVVIESNVLSSGEGGGLGGGIIGQRGKVREVRRDHRGDPVVYAVGYELHPDAFVKVADLGKLAAERSAFAVGDEVRVTGSTADPYHVHRVGDVGKVASISDRGSVRVEVRGFRQYVNPADLVKIEAPAFAVGDKVKITGKGIGGQYLHGGAIWHTHDIGATGEVVGLRPARHGRRHTALVKVGNRTQSVDLGHIEKVEAPVFAVGDKVRVTGSGAFPCNAFAVGDVGEVVDFSSPQRDGSRIPYVKVRLSRQYVAASELSKVEAPAKATLAAWERELYALGAKPAAPVIPGGFKVGDKVTVSGSSVFGNGGRNRTGVVIDPATKPGYAHRGATQVFVKYDVGGWDIYRPSSLTLTADLPLKAGDIAVVTGEAFYTESGTREKVDGFVEGDLASVTNAADRDGDVYLRSLTGACEHVSETVLRKATPDEAKRFAAQEKALAALIVAANELGIPAHSPRVEKALAALTS